MGKLVIAVAKDEVRNIVGYRLFDPELDQSYNITLNMIKDYEDDIDNFKMENGHLREVEGLESNYPMLSPGWRVNRNKENRVAFWKTGESSIKLINYSGKVDYCELSNVFDLISDDTITNKICLRTLESDIRAKAEVALGITLDDIQTPKLRVEKGGVVGKREKGSWLEVGKDGLTWGSGTKSVEYQISIKLRQSGKTDLKSFSIKEYDMLTSSEIYFCNLGVNWIKARIKKNLSEMSRLGLSDGNILVKYSSSVSFKTNSNTIKGSRYNNIYAVIDTDDKIIRVHTSYKDIEDIIDEITDITNVYAREPYKEISTIVRNLHMEKPRYDIEFIGSGIERATGDMKLIAKIKELDREYYIGLCGIANYDLYCKWAESLDEDDSNFKYMDLRDLVEDIIKTK